MACNVAESHTVLMHRVVATQVWRVAAPQASRRYCTYPSLMHASVCCTNCNSWPCHKRPVHQSSYEYITAHLCRRLYVYSKRVKLISLVRLIWYGFVVRL